MGEEMKESLEQVRQWNHLYAIGQRVIVTKDLGEQVFTKTKTEAFVAQSGHAVIFVEDITGFYLLERVAEGYKKANADDVKDTIITDYCDNCVDHDDYDCPDNNCPAWKALWLLAEISAGITK